MVSLATVYKILYMNMLSTLREVEEWSIDGPPIYNLKDLLPKLLLRKFVGVSYSFSFNLADREIIVVNKE